MDAVIGTILFLLLVSIPVLLVQPDLPSNIARAIVDWNTSRKGALHDAKVTNVMLKMGAVDRETYRRIESAQRKHSGSS